MTEFGNVLLDLQNVPIASILVISGILFLLMALAGRVSEHIEVPQSRQNLAAVLGILLLVGGIILSFIPDPAETASTGGDTSGDGSSGVSVPPPPTMDPTEMAEPLPTEVPVHYAFDWQGEEMASRSFRPAANATFDFGAGGLTITGTAKEDRIWVDIGDLPQNVLVAASFQVLSDGCNFSIGFGSGDSHRPDYHLSLDADGVAFLKNRDDSFPDNNWQNLFAELSNYTVQPNAPYEVELERNDSAVTAYLNETRVLRVTQAYDEMAGINDLNRLYVTTEPARRNVTCSAALEALAVAALE